MNRVTAAIWSAMLLATGFGVVPVVVALLRRTLNAARNIEHYTAEMLDGGIGIANNTANVAALKETISVAPQLIAGAESLERHTATIKMALTAPAPATDNSQVKGEEVEL